MKNGRICFLWLVLLLAPELVKAQWVGGGTGPYYYDSPENWFNGVANGQFTNQIATGLTVLFREGVVLPSGTSLYLTMAKTDANMTFKGDGLVLPLRLNGSVVTALNSGGRFFTFGSLLPAERLDIDLGSADRSFIVAKGDTIQLLNTVSSSGSSGLIKNGSGVLELWDRGNSFAGSIQVLAGALVFSSIARVGEASALGKPLTAEQAVIRLGGGASSSVQLQFGGTNVAALSDAVTDRAICWQGAESTYTLENQSGCKLTLTADFQNLATGNNSAQLIISGKNGSVTEVQGVIGDVGVGRSTALLANGQNNAGSSYILRISGTANTFGGAVFTGYNTILEVATLADRGVASSLGTGAINPLISIGGTGSTYGSTLCYIGNADSSTDRPVNLQFRNNSTNVISNDSSANASLSFTNTSAWTVVKGGTAGNNTLSLRGSSTGTTTIAGKLVDEGSNSANKTSLTVNSSGVWRLTNENSYSGSTTITAGTLLVDGALSKTSALQVAGGTLAGSGKINFAATVSVGRGAILAPGEEGKIGCLSLGSLALQNGSVYRITLDSDQGVADMVLASGLVTLGAQDCVMIVQDIGNSLLAMGVNLTVLRSSVGISGCFTNQFLQIGENLFELSYNDKEINLLVIPELETWLLVACGCGLLPFIQPKRRP